MYKKVEEDYFKPMVHRDKELRLAVKLGTKLLDAINKGADFCSVRFIK